MSDYNTFFNNVKQFTEESTGQKCPPKPEKAMTRKEVDFLIKMVFSECFELYKTIEKNDNSVETSLKIILEKAIEDEKKKQQQNSVPDSETSVIADQADAGADIIYYLANGFSKIGVNLGSVLQTVHQANMAKKFPDGTFHRNQEGKVIKPNNWKEPNIKKCIIDQQQQ